MKWWWWWWELETWQMDPPPTPPHLISPLPSPICGLFSTRLKVSDPVMAFVTDSVRSPMGRRRPFLATGCVPYAVLLLFLMYPAAGVGAGLPVYFGCFYIFFYLANTYTVPRGHNFIFPRLLISFC